MPQTGSLSLRIRSLLTGSADLASIKSDLDQAFSVEFANGTGAFQANASWSDVRSLGSNANEDIDFAGVLSAMLGGTVTFTAVKAIAIVSARTNTVNLSVTRPASNGLPLFLAAGDGVPVHPGGFFAHASPSAAGIVVTAGTGDLLNVANGAALSSYYIFVIGNV